VGTDLIVEMLNRILRPEQRTTVLLETMAGKGSEVGRTFEELRAIIDRVDHEDGSSSPVDMKKGSGPRDGGMWPADRVQVLTQAVLLRRAGYSVNRADISYLGSHHRASIEVGQDAETEVRELVALARQVAAQELPPPPLLNDPRCPRCSLAPLCMPDETNYLLERSGEQRNQNRKP